MFFLLRCMFWLGIVFYWMPWGETPTGAPLSVQSLSNLALSNLARDAGGMGANLLAGKIEEICRKSPADCLAAASHLPHMAKTSLVDTRGQSAASEAVAGSQREPSHPTVSHAVASGFEHWQLRLRD